jgi:predicted nucleic acid-binding protein
VSASSVVLSELWRSAQGAALRRYVLMIERQLRHLVFAPSHRDWRQVGEYLTTRLPRDGRRPSPELLNTIRKEQNDALIALSSWNLGHVVVTCDDDFEPIRDWAKPPAGSLVRLPAPTPSAGGQP